MASISVCIIAKNEEQLLKQCLNSIKNIADEIIFVDTGSIDKTKEIAKDFNAKIYDFKWVDDFSAARNFAIEKATGSWILFLDADEVLSEESKDKIKTLTDNNDEVAYELTIRTYSNTAINQDWKPLTEPHKDFKGYYDLFVTRLFQNKKEIFFSGKVHETIHDSLKKADKKPKKADILIRHYEFLKTKEVVEEKKLGYFDLLQEKLKQNPKDAYTHHQIGVYLRDVKHDIQGALKHFQEAILCNRKCKEAYNDLAVLLFQLNKIEDGIKVLHSDIAVNNDPNAYMNLAVLFFRAKDFDAVLRTINAMEVSLKNIDIPKAYALKARAHIEKKEFAEAEKAFEKALSLDLNNNYYQEQISFCKQNK